MRGQRQYKGRSPSEPRPDDSYSYQPSPEPSQYPAFDNTHLRNASPCSFHSSKSLWTKWTRTTLLSSLVMYSMLSRLITLSPTRSNLLMVHLLPPKSRAGTPRRIPRPDYLLYALQRRHGTRMYSTTSPSRSCSDSTTRPRNTQPSMQAWGRSSWWSRAAAWKGSPAGGILLVAMRCLLVVRASGCSNTAGASYVAIT